QITFGDWNVNNVAHPSRLQPWNSCKPEARATLLLKLKNDFAVAFALRGVCNRGFDFTQWISLLDFRLQQTTPGHIENRSKCLHPLGWSGFVVPFIDPDAAKSEVFENEKPGRNFQRLQAHRAKTHERAARSETIGETQSAVTADGV